MAANAEVRTERRQGWLRQLLLATGIVALAGGVGMTGCTSASSAEPGIRLFHAGIVSFSYTSSGGRVTRARVPLTGVITVPRTPGRHPVVVVEHGTHGDCQKLPRSGRAPLGPGRSFGPGGAYQCPPGSREVPSDRGFEYLMRGLVRANFAAVSIDVNGATLVDSSTGTSAGSINDALRRGVAFRAEMLRATLDRLAIAARGGTNRFGTPLQDRLDLHRVGLVGHSRGGEGVVSATRLPGSHPYRIQGVFLLSPTDTLGVRVPGDIALGSLISYCDNDVTDLAGVRYFDDAVAQPHTRPRLETVLLGANHAFFNTQWEDDWAGQQPKREWCSPAGSHGTGRLTRGAQQAIATRAVRAFMLGQVAGTRGAVLTAPVGSAQALSSISPPSPGQRLLARATSTAPLTLGQGGVRLAPRGLARFAYCTPAGAGCGRGVFDRGTTTYRVDWSRPDASLSFGLSARDQDLHLYRELTLRMATPTAVAGGDLRHPPVLTTAGQSQSVDVELVDASGRSASVTVGGAQSALRYPPGSETTAKAVLGAITVPLSAFHSVDTTRLKSIRLRFDNAPRGTLYMSDLAAVR